jgi:GR25 family glycosyltransferase involved in LPS biosynthesis
VREELARMGRNHITVFPGVADENGTLGCALAHRNLLNSTDPRSQEILWVAEDDVVFDGTRDELEACIAEFVSDSGLDVLCLAERTSGPTLTISSRIALTVTTLTTACYLVKPWAVDRLRQSFHESVVLLSMGYPPIVGAIDQHWRSLQWSELTFCIPRKNLARQAPSFSDIRQMDVDYYRSNRKRRGGKK